MKPDCVRISPKVLDAERGDRTGDLHGVGEVQHFELDLAAHAALEADFLGRREVPVVAVRRADVAERARQRAERVGRRDGEAGGSSQLADAALLRRDAVRYRTAAQCARSAYPSVAPSPLPGLAILHTREDVQVLVLLRTDIGKPLSMPMIDEIVQPPRMACRRRSAPSACPRRTAARRSARHDLVRHVEQADGVFGVEVVGVLRFAVGSGAGEEVASRRTGCPSAGCRCS